MAERPLTPRHRPVEARVSLDAIRANVGTIRALVAPARLAAVVKADAYGHGAVPVSRAAVEAGASWLAVALVEEGVELRQAGIDAPILILSEPPADAMATAVSTELTPTVYSRGGVEAVDTAARRAGRTVGVHLKVDTGMHRVGAAPDQALHLARAIAGSDVLELEGLWTHFAVADEPERPDTKGQLARFDAVVEELAADGIRAHLLHAANSAGAVAHPGSRFDLVRCGIVLYGYPPAPGLAGTPPLTPAMSVVAEVSQVKQVSAGEGISYGLRYAPRVDTVVATVPIGYADGVPRALAGAGGEVLIGGCRRPMAGTVTMDQLMVDCGPDADVRAGDEVVLLGRQGNEGIDADDWAEKLGTISYEVITRIGPRVPRVYT